MLVDPPNKKFCGAFIKATPTGPPEAQSFNMKIERIKIKCFKVFKDIEINDLPNMCVFIGANGSGKSTLFDSFSFLSDCLRSNVKIAVNRRGGFKEVISRGQKGDILFEIKFRDTEEGKQSPLITYSLKIGLKKNAPIVKSEVLQ